MIADTLAPPPLAGSWTLPSFAGFAALTGPLWRERESGSLALHIVHERTNISGRIHGGMAMNLLQLRLAHAARQAAEGAAPGSHAQWVSLNVELMDSAKAGAWVEARAQVTRTTRKLVFVSGGLYSDGRCLVTGSAVFQFAAPLRERPVAGIVAPPEGFHMLQPREPYTAYIDSVYERFDAAGRRFGAFHVGDRHLESDGGPHVDTGMLLLLADLYLGRAAGDAAGTRCVTLGMNLSQLAPIVSGDLVEIESSAQGGSGEVFVVTGRFTVRGQAVMLAGSTWKAVVVPPPAAPCAPASL